MGDTSRDFRKLTVWQRGHEIAMQTYKVTESFPKSQLYSLTNQMQRAAVSIPANIAEGCGRGSVAELARFMRIAQGSACELAYYLLLSAGLGYLEQETSVAMSDNVNSINRMLAAYIRTLKANG